MCLCHIIASFNLRNMNLHSYYAMLLDGEDYWRYNLKKLNLRKDKRIMQ